MHTERELLMGSKIGWNIEEHWQAEKRKETNMGTNYQGHKLSIK